VSTVLEQGHRHPGPHQRSQDQPPGWTPALELARNRRPPDHRRV